MEHEGLGRLEQIIEKLLQQFADLRQEKERLEHDLTQRNREISELRGMALTLQEEKNMIHERVSSLLTSLEKWEETQVRSSQMGKLAENAGGQDLNSSAADQAASGA